MAARSIGIGVIGMGWMGTAHSRAYNMVRDRFPDCPLIPRLTICADDVADRAEAARERFGFAASTSDWHRASEHQRMSAASEKAGSVNVALQRLFARRTTNQYREADGFREEMDKCTGSTRRGRGPDTCTRIAEITWEQPSPRRDGRPLAKTGHTGTGSPKAQWRCQARRAMHHSRNQ